MIFRGICVLMMCLLPGVAVAQGLPQPAGDHVTDLGDLLSPAAEARITATLQAGRQETGVHVTILTVGSLANHGGAGQRIEDYAKAVFNTWGIGDATRHDGVLILVARDDRAARIALGSGYDAVWDGQAQRVIDTALLPAFRDGRYEQGIEAAATATLERVARPWKAGLSASAKEDEPGPVSTGVLLVLAAALAFVAIMRREEIGDRFATWKRCPNCGDRKLSRRREETYPPTTTAYGQGVVRTSCAACGHEVRRHYTLAKLNPGEGGDGGFGGGRSSGGGATGRW